MEELIILGTGYAMALDCYNTCFLLKNSKFIFCTSNFKNFQKF